MPLSHVANTAPHLLGTSRAQNCVSARSTKKGHTHMKKKSNFLFNAQVGIAGIGLLYVFAIYYYVGSRIHDRASSGVAQFFRDASAQPFSGSSSKHLNKLHRKVKNRESLTIGNQTDAAQTLLNGEETILHREKFHFAYHRPTSDIFVSPRLPEWVKTYAGWHAEQRLRFTRADSDSGNLTFAPGTKFLIIRCLEMDKCGGASDRLQDMPFNLMIANRTNRVLLVKWERPAPLERFLVPPPGGIDWRVPEGMFDEMDMHLRMNEESDSNIVSVIRRDSAAPIFRAYEKKLGHKIYHELFRLFFAPSKELSTRIETTMKSLDLVPKHYSSVHLRVKYPTAGIKEEGFTFEKHKSKIVNWAINAVNCAAELHPRSTIYVSSDNNDTVGYLLEDSHFAKHAALHTAAENLSTNSTHLPLVMKLVSRDYSTENPHVEFSKDVEAGSFMSVFEDLMIMGLGKCVAHGVGGYGRLAAALGGGECVVAHRGRHSKRCSDAIAKGSANV